MKMKRTRQGAGDHPNQGKANQAYSGKVYPIQDGEGMDRDEDLSLPVAAMEYVWLYDHRRGISLRKLADRDGVSVERVSFGVERAKALEVRSSGEEGTGIPGRRDEPGFELIPLFPIGPFTPQSACSHREPIEKGSRFCCMVCHASGMDDHPRLRKGPEKKLSQVPAPAGAAPAALSDEGPVETRKKKRRRRFSAVAVA